MKVLVISTVRFRLNGITSVILNYYRNIDKTEIHMDFVVPNEISEEYSKEFKANGSQVFYIPRKSNPIKYQIELYKVIKKNDYDIVHIHGNSSLMLIDLWPVVKAKVPVRIVHSHNTSCSHLILHKILSPIFNRFYTHGFACGEDAGKWLFKDKEFEILKNGIDLEKYSFNTEIRELYRQKINAKNKVVIGHIGNFIEQKNHKFILEWYLELTKKNNNYLLLMIGDGILLEEMKEKANILGLADKVIFLGKTTEVSNYLQAMDIFVLPSLHEGLPVVLIEAQASGLPCIVSDKVSEEANITGSIKYVDIKDKHKWILAIKQTTYILYNEDRKEVCKKWKKNLIDKGYDISNNANKMVSLYKTYFNSKKWRDKNDL